MGMKVINRNLTNKNKYVAFKKIYNWSEIENNIRDVIQ
jgi:hypothetical protein